MTTFLSLTKLATLFALLSNIFRSLSEATGTSKLLRPLVSDDLSDGFSQDSLPQGGRNEKPARDQPDLFL